MFRRFALMGCLLLSCSAAALAQTTPVKAPPPPPEVEVDKDEILRRGNMVQAVGTIQQSPLDLIAESLQTPEDDSHKWYVTVVTQNDCPPCESLKKAFASAAELKIWANPGEPEKSWAHYQVRSLDDPTQAAWFKSIRHQIPSTPAIVIQPPRNNAYGDNSTTVNILVGYDGDPAKLSAKIRESIVTYVAAIERPRSGGISRSLAPKAFKAKSSLEVPTRGHQQAAPFDIPADPFAVDKRSPEPMFPPAPQAMTIDQIQQAVQGVQGFGFLAPAEFVVQCLQTGLRTVQEVQAAWLQFLQRRQPTPVNPSPTVIPSVIVPGTPQPAQPAITDILGGILKVLVPQQQTQPSGGLGDLLNGVLNAGTWVKWIVGFFGLTSVMNIFLGGLQLWRTYRKATGGGTLLDDETFKRLVDALQQNTNATNLNNVVNASEALKQAIAPAKAVAAS